MKPASHHFALVVESDEPLRVKLADALVSRGYVVHVASSAEAAAGLSLEVGFSVVVIGPTQLPLAAPAVRSLLRQEGLRKAVVFRDATLGGSTSGIAPEDLVEVKANENHAARLRMLVPLADATGSVERKRKTNKQKS